MALSADRKNTDRRDAIDFAFPMASSQVFYVGGIAMLNSAGNAVVGAAGEGLIPAGIVQEAATPTGAAVAGEYLKTKGGCFRLKNGDTITKAHIGDLAFVGDDETVYKDGTGRSALGVIVDVDSFGVWVLIQPGVQAVAGNQQAISLYVRTLVGATALRAGFVATRPGIIKNIRSVLLGAGLATGNATLTGKINTVAITNGALTITQSGSAIGDIDIATPTALNVFAAGDLVEVTGGGTNTDATAYAEVTFDVVYL